MTARFLSGVSLKGMKLTWDQHFNKAAVPTPHCDKGDWAQVLRCNLALATFAAAAAAAQLD